MDFGKPSPMGRFVKYMLITYGVIIAVVLLVLFTDVFKTKQDNELPPIIWVLVAVVFLLTLITILATSLKMLDVINDGNSKLDSETARAIAFRDSYTQIRRDAFFDKLQQKDFETAYEIIEKIDHTAGYKKLAEQLRIQADKYRDATDTDRMSQSIAHIEKLLDNHQWAKAGEQIELLVKECPNNEKALSMRQRLAEKKDERKKVLLNAWDDAVKRRATDRSLEILRELDQYLTPNEGLALQEAARDVFRTKLHNLGVQFSLAVSGKQWARALEAGMEIIRDFPNSRMAEEIREKIDALKKQAGKKA
jgi:hypothetical protein